ncbi:MAG: ATP-grasp domain-containing protein [Bacteroidales bacterium]|nr:ATP-grasp domain-containing protein [Bacteroidales bacterium]
MEKKNKLVVILHNKVYDHSNPDEADVLQQVNLVAEAYRQLGYDAFPMELGKNPYNDILKVKKRRPLFVFNLVESVFEKGELLYIGPALLNAHHIQYTGTPLEALFITTNKLLAKRMMNHYKISTPEFYQVNEAERLEPAKRYIVKPVWEDGSVGLDEDAVFDVNDSIKMKRIATLSPTHYFIEEYIEGREFNISILGGKGKINVLPPAEMIFKDFPPGKPRIIGYKAKWNTQSTEYKNTIRSFETPDTKSFLYSELKKICLNCWKYFNLKGYARVDFRVDGDSNPYVIEINGNPCISPDSGFIAAARYAGFDNQTIIQRISEELN